LTFHQVRILLTQFHGPRLLEIVNGRSPDESEVIAFIHHCVH
jgi:hypothetical protein